MHDHEAVRAFKIHGHDARAAWGIGARFLPAGRPTLIEEPGIRQACRPSRTGQRLSCEGQCGAERAGIRKINHAYDTVRHRVHAEEAPSTSMPLANAARQRRQEPL